MTLCMLSKRWHYTLETICECSQDAASRSINEIQLTKCIKCCHESAFSNCPILLLFNLISSVMDFLDKSLRKTRPLTCVLYFLFNFSMIPNGAVSRFFSLSDRVVYVHISYMLVNHRFPLIELYFLFSRYLQDKHISSSSSGSTPDNAVTKWP